MSGLSNFDLESLRQEILKEFRDDVRQMCREVFTEMFGKRPMEEEDSETRTIVSKPLKGKQKIAKNLAEPEWEKDMKKQMNQLQNAMKKLGPNHNFIDLDLEEDEPLPPKYKFPDIKKYDGTDDPHLHLQQYVTFMKPTGLTKA